MKLKSQLDITDGVKTAADIVEKVVDTKAPVFRSSIR